MDRVLCSNNKSGICWSLHALWDAEILKRIDPSELEKERIATKKTFNIEKLTMKLNELVCEVYDYPEYYGIEDYVQKYKNISVYLVRMASINISNILNANGPRKTIQNGHIQ